ncbi:MAG: caspase family protein [Gemmataceae bacterium]
MSPLRRFAFLVSMMVVLARSAPTFAQPDPKLNPSFGTVVLKAGFQPDPLVKVLQAGGELQTKLAGVEAFVAKAPSFRLEYAAGKYPLSFTVRSSGDSTLLIHLPDGSWIADDDSGGGLDPLIRFGQPLSGRYDIYVGTIGKAPVDVKLFITEGVVPGQAAVRPDPKLNPTYGSAKLNAGFQPDPLVKSVQAGGELLTNLGGVNAYVAKAPDFRIEYAAGKFPLNFTVKSVGDTTLLINLPDGTWIADDDSGGGLDPLIRLAKPQSGVYGIYVGSLSKNLVQADLLITEADVSKKPAVPYNPNLPECHIVSAGIDNYRTQQPLKGCLNDARNIVAAFEGQTGTMFRSVKQTVLLDDRASHGAITKAFQGFLKQGAAGDTMVLFLSGHGARTNGNKGPTWFFLPFDFQPKQFVNTALTDKQILDISHQIAKQKKNVVVIIDACFVGQLANNAQAHLQNLQSANQGGLVLLLSSSPTQESTALGNFSAYAKAFFDAMSGHGDLNRDSKITLGEIQAYTKKRTSDLLIAARSPNKQDAIVTWSPSLSKDSLLGYAGKATPINVAATRPLSKDPPRRLAGTETLPGYGRLSFELHKDGRVVMTDAKDTAEGVWRRQGNQYTLSFANGAIVYVGTENGATISGTASGPAARQAGRQTWNWTVQ